MAKLEYFINKHHFTNLNKRLNSKLEMSEIKINQKQFILELFYICGQFRIAIDRSFTMWDITREAAVVAIKYVMPQLDNTFLGKWDEMINPVLNISRSILKSSSNEVFDRIPKQFN